MFKAPNMKGISKMFLFLTGFTMFTLVHMMEGFDSGKGQWYSILFTLFVVSLLNKHVFYLLCDTFFFNFGVCNVRYHKHVRTSQYVSSLDNCLCPGARRSPVE